MVNAEKYRDLIIEIFKTELPNFARFKRRDLF